MIFLGYYRYSNFIQNALKLITFIIYVLLNNFIIIL